MSDQIITGIGNEVIAFATLFIAVLIPSVIYLWRNALRSQNIHTMTSASGRVEIPTVYNRDTCPICLGEHALPLETNCGHLFCGACLQQYCSISNFIVVSCPLCRSEVNIIFVCFTNTETENPALQDSRQSIYNFVDQYNQRCSLFRRTSARHAGLLQAGGGAFAAKSPSARRSAATANINNPSQLYKQTQSRTSCLELLQVLLDWPTTMRHLWRELISVNGFMYGTRAPIGLCIIAAIVYIVSPLDIIPEGIFGLLGLLDDLFVILMIGLYMSIIYRRLVLMRGAASSGF